MWLQANFTRGVIVTGINIKAEGITYYMAAAANRQKAPALNGGRCFAMNGVEFGRESSLRQAAQLKDFCHGMCNRYVACRGSRTVSASILAMCQYHLVGAVAMVFKHGSATFEQPYQLHQPHRQRHRQPKGYQPNLAIRNRMAFLFARGDDGFVLKPQAEDGVIGVLVWVGWGMVGHLSATCRR